MFMSDFHKQADGPLSVIFSDTFSNIQTLQG